MGFAILRPAKLSFSNPLGYLEPMVCMGFWLGKLRAILDLHQEGACFPENSGRLFAHGRMALNSTRTAVLLSWLHHLGKGTKTLLLGWLTESQNVC